MGYVSRVGVASMTSYVANRSPEESKSRHAGRESKKNIYIKLKEANTLLVPPRKVRHVFPTVWRTTTD